MNYNQSIIFIGLTINLGWLKFIDKEKKGICAHCEIYVDYKLWDNMVKAYLSTGLYGVRLLKMPYSVLCCWQRCYARYKSNTSIYPLLLIDAITIQIQLSDNTKESRVSVNVCLDLKVQSDLKATLKSVNFESPEAKMQFTKRLFIARECFGIDIVAFHFISN